MRYSEQNKYPYIYLPIIGGVCFCFARKYSIVIVNTTVVRRRVVYIGTLTPRTDSIEASFFLKKKNSKHQSEFNLNRNACA
jgi:hypothetical protein